MPAPYTQVTLAQLIVQISTLLDDQSAVYWVPQEITYAIYEALRVFGSVTSYWRNRGQFTITPNDPSPIYDLSALLPGLRSRSTTLSQICTEIQYHLLESPTGIAGTGGSGQISIVAILQAIQRARNRFVIDCCLPDTVHAQYVAPPPPDGLITFSQSSVYVHRLGWQDAGGAWANLWRQDAWTFDHSDLIWPADPGIPLAYSEAELAPLTLQLYPPPVSAGTLEAVTVDSLLVDATNANAVFNIPDEWIHAVKYGALEEILSGGNQAVDPVRAQYAAQRYQQAVAFAKDARSVIRLTCNGIPLAIDSMAAIDAGFPYWRNQTGSPQMAGIMYDLAALNPGIPDQNYSIAADLAIPAPLPALNDYIQIGQENLQDITDYCMNYLNFKCGGNELKFTMGNLDNFQRALATRKGVNAAKIMYFEPLFGQWQREEGMRPDMVGAK